MCTRVKQLRFVVLSRFVLYLYARDVITVILYDSKLHVKDLCVHSTFPSY